MANTSPIPGMSLEQFAAMLGISPDDPRIGQYDAGQTPQGAMPLDQIVQAMTAQSPDRRTPGNPFNPETQTLGSQMSQGFLSGGAYRGLANPQGNASPDGNGAGRYSDQQLMTGISFIPGVYANQQWHQGFVNAGGGSGNANISANINAQDAGNPLPRAMATFLAQHPNGTFQDFMAQPGVSDAMRASGQSVSQADFARMGQLISGYGISQGMAGGAYNPQLAAQVKANPNLAPPQWQNGQLIGPDGTIHARFSGDAEGNYGNVNGTGTPPPNAGGSGTGTPPPGAPAGGTGTPAGPNQDELNWEAQMRSNYMNSPYFNPRGANTWSIQNTPFSTMATAFGGATSMPGNTPQFGGSMAGVPLPGSNSMGTPDPTAATSTNLSAGTSATPQGANAAVNNMTGGTVGNTPAQPSYFAPQPNTGDSYVSPFANRNSGNAGDTSANTYAPTVTR